MAVCEQDIVVAYRILGVVADVARNGDESHSQHHCLQLAVMT